MRNIFLISLCLVCAHVSMAQPITLDQVVGVIGRNAIYLSDIENQYLQMQAQGYPQQSNARCDILEELLFQKLLLNQAEIDSVEVTDGEVDSELDQRLRYFIAQAGGESQLEDYFGKTIEEIKEDFREIIREQMLTSRMQGQITDGVSVTPAEINAFFKQIPADSLPLIETEYEIEQIVVYPEITKAEKDRIKAELQQVRQDIIDKKTRFDVYATLWSDDKESGKTGGDIGFINRADVVPQFAAAAFNLSKGEISKVVETEFGFHLIELIERRGEQIHVRHILKKPKVYAAQKQAAASLLDSVVKLVRMDTLTFGQAATKYSQDKDTKNNSGLMSNEYTGSSKFQVSEIDPGIFYEARQLGVGEISKPFESVDNRGYAVYKVIRIRSKTSPHVANLQDDYQRIKDMALQEKQQKAVKKWIMDKQSQTYIFIDPEYRNCNFQFGSWMQ